MDLSGTILSIEQVTPAWLTGVLRQSGHLSSGTVERVSIKADPRGFSSKVYHLDISYSGEASPHSPDRLFLKISSPNLVQGDADPDYSFKEVLFYRDVLAGRSPDYILPCYSSTVDTTTGASHILLKDVSQAYETCTAESRSHNCFKAMSALAHHHALWWDHPRLGKDVGSFTSKDEREREVEDSVSHTVRFMDELGDRLQPKWRSNYDKVLVSLPYLFRRHTSGRNLTLAHGDSHLGNFLFPRDPARNHAYLIDWQFWHPTIPGTDTAFLIATEWDSSVRRELERALLRTYYGILTQCGVASYSWEECWNDYRLSVILVCIFIPVWRWAVFKWPVDVSVVDKSMTAFEELNCSEFLNGDAGTP